MWKSILAVESEGKSLAKLELISQDLSSEMSTLRDIVGPVLTGVGVPLLEEYSKNFQKVFPVFLVFFFCRNSNFGLNSIHKNRLWMK